MHHFCWSLPPPSRHPFSKGLGLQGEAQVVSCAMVAIKALLLVLYEDKVTLLHLIAVDGVMHER